jgi:predicted aspartyl protease
MGHFEIACKTKMVKEVTAEDVEEMQGAFFLGSVTKESEDQWHVELPINGTPVKFKINTGADVRAMSQTTYQRMQQRPRLVNIVTDVRSPGGRFDCMG